MSTKEWVITIIIALIVALIIRLFVFEIVRVDGPSMNETLYTNDRVYVEKLVFRFKGPQRGDIVECYDRKFDIVMYGKRKNTYIKRVIGLPGDTVEIVGGTTYINGKVFPSPFLTAYNATVGSYDGKWVVPAGQYFVMGDNRANSEDSRLPEVGFIPRADIKGRGVLRLYPFNKIGVLK